LIFKRKDCAIVFKRFSANDLIKYKGKEDTNEFKDLHIPMRISRMLDYNCVGYSSEFIYNYKCAFREAVGLFNCLAQSWELSIPGKIK
jgi:hypothetical protein